MFEFSGRQFIDFMTFMNRFEQAFTWLVDAISGVIDVIKSSPLYYVPITLVTLILLAGAIALLIFNISDRGYSQGTVSRFNGWFGNSRIGESRIGYARFDTSPVGSLLLFKARQHYREKKRADEMAQAAYEKIVEEQEALQNRHRLEQQDEIRRLYNASLADEYFRNNPGRTKISIEGKEFFNDLDAPWYQKKYGRSYAMVSRSKDDKSKAPSSPRSRMIDVTVDDDE